MNRPSSKSDKLSEWAPLSPDQTGLIDLALQLNEHERAREATLRTALLDLSSRIRRDHFELGRILHNYRDLYKAEGMWTKFCAAIQFNVRTAHRAIKSYEAAAQADVVLRHVASVRGIDLAEKKNRLLLQSVVELAPRGRALSEAEASSLLKRAQEALVTKPKATLPSSSKDPLDRVYRYARDVFEHADPGHREKMLLALYTRLNAYFGIGKSMAVPFASSPALVIYPPEMN